MGLLGTAAKVAVASSVHGRVQRRQQNRWAAQDQAAMAPPPSAPRSPQAAPNSDPMSDKLAQLAQLGQLRDGGILTDAEFDAKKALILGS